MILVDTTVWIQHLRSGVPRLTLRLEEGTVCCHPFVVGELACGNLRRREQFLDLLRDLTQLDAVAHEEALSFLESHHLHGRGLGWVDVHLLAAARLSQSPLWTLDGALAAAAADLGLAAR